MNFRLKLVENSKVQYRLFEQAGENLQLVNGKITRHHMYYDVGTLAVKTCSALPAKMKTLNDPNVTAHDAVFFSIYLI